MKFDDLLVYVGEFGAFQRRLLFITALAAVCFTWQKLLIIFTLPKPNYRCAIPSYANDSYEVQSPQHQSLINLTVPTDTENGGYTMCHIYRRQYLGPNYNLMVNDTSSMALDANMTVEECNRWVFDKSIVQSSITEDLSIVCENTLLRSHAFLAMFIGMSVAAVAQGIFSDMFGRRKVYLVSAILLIASSILGVFINSISTLILSRFFSALSAVALHQSVFVIAVEFCGKSARKIVTVALEISVVTAELCMAGLGFLLDDWRHFSAVLAAPSVLLLPCWFLLTESPRWLLSKGREEEAKEIILKAARFNKVDLSPDILQDLHDIEKKTSDKPWALFQNARTAARYCIMYCNWILVSLVSYGITLNVNNLSGNLYLNYAIMVACKPLSMVFFYLTVDRIGRRLLFMGIALMCGLALLSLIIPIMIKGGEAPETLTAMQVMSVMGIMSMTVEYSVIYLYTAELWPTVFRNFGVGSSSAISRIGSVVSPYVVDMGYLVEGRFSRGVPMIVCGAAAFLMGALTLSLPETHGKPLPEDVQDVKEFDRLTATRTPTSDSIEMKDKTSDA